jgi:YNFM family putative membrane transporter
MATKADHASALQALVFSQVCAAFTTIYITQPVLPVIRQEFGVDATTASYTIAAVVLGIALATLPLRPCPSGRWPIGSPSNPSSWPGDRWWPPAD